MYVPGSNSARERLATAFRDAAKQAGSARPGRHCGLAQWIAPYPYDQMHVRDRFSPPNLHYLAGTDEYGRDVFSRLLFGSQLSLALGTTATLISMAVGVPLGLIVGTAVA